MTQKGYFFDIYSHLRAVIYIFSVGKLYGRGADGRKIKAETPPKWILLEHPKTAKKSNNKIIFKRIS